MDKQTFDVNGNIPVKEWVEYKDNPALDVLLDIVMIKTRCENELIRNEVMMQEISYPVLFYLLIPNLENTLTVISQCRDEHPNICTNQNSSITIRIIKS